MSDRKVFNEIEGLGDTGIEFLAAIGVEDIVSLARSDGNSLHREMVQANSLLHIDQEVPAADEVERWIEQARDHLPVGYASEVVRLPAAAEVSEVEVLAAIPIPRSLIVEQKISVKDVPPMEDFVEIDPVVSPRPTAEESTPRSTVRTTPKSVRVRNVGTPLAPRPYVSPLENIDVGENVETRVPREVKPLEKSPGRDIRKTASSRLNEGKKLHSRRYIRGVLHPQPIRIRCAAIFSMLAILLLPATFVAGGLILFYKEKMIWLAAVPVAAILFGLLYLMYARGMKCRICGQPLFAPKACHRHVKAHHIPVIGYILPTSLQILLFHWFRCMYCGTSIRLKE